MKSLMQEVLGAAWQRLHPGLQAHYRDGTSTDIGHMDIAYPIGMQPLLSALRLIGALVDRRGRAVATTVVKQVAGKHQHWRRTFRFANGQMVQFDSVWVATPEGHLIEYVNSLVGLEMAPFVVGDCLHYRGVRFVVKLGRFLLPIPEWLALGHTTITEQAIDDRHFSMDFRLTHPLFGELFRYSGTFEADCSQTSNV